MAAAILWVAAPVLGQSIDAPHAPMTLQLRDGVLDGAEFARRLIAPPSLGPEARADLAQITANRKALFDISHRIGRSAGRADFAVFYDSETGDDLIRALTQLAEYNDLSIALHPLQDAGAQSLAQQLGLDLWPSYVFPTVMLRGDVPTDLLVRYVTPQGTTN